VSKAVAQPVTAHLQELRGRIIKAGAAVLVGTILAFIYRGPIFDLIIAPYEQVAADRALVFFRPTEAFSLFMRLSLFAGFVFASPVVLWQLWAFVAPALSKREKRVVIPIVLALTVLFLAGITFGYWSLERGLGFLIDFGGEDLAPVIEFGLVNATMHKRDEAVAVDDLHALARIYRRIALAALTGEKE